jgi:phosphinothricin acetyltransferase
VIGTVRDVEPERDAAVCLEIYAPFIRETAVSFEEIVPTLEEFEGRIRSTTATHPWLVMEVEGKVVGYAYASQHRPRAAYRWTAEVTVYIDAHHHRSGIGRRLYVELLGRLRRQGFRLAVAGITLPNDASVGLHRAIGFEPVGVYRRVGWKLGAWRDVVWLELQLRDPTDQETGGAAPPEPLPPSAAPSPTGESTVAPRAESPGAPGARPS